MPHTQSRRTDFLNMRVSTEGKKILSLLQEHHGLTQTGVIEMLLRKAVREAGIPVSAYRTPTPDSSSDKEVDTSNAA